jgi:hypothetical protein
MSDLKVDEKPKLTPQEFWEWRAHINWMFKVSSDLKLAELEAKMMKSEYENKVMQLQLHNKTRLESAKQAVETSKGEYNALKSRIEERLKISLNNKAIDELTFEVKEIPSN